IGLAAVLGEGGDALGAAGALVEGGFLGGLLGAVGEAALEGGGAEVGAGDGGFVVVLDGEAGDAGVDGGLEIPAGLGLMGGEDGVAEAEAAGPFDAVAEGLVLEGESRKFGGGRGGFLRGGGGGAGRVLRKRGGAEDGKGDADTHGGVGECRPSRTLVSV